MGKVPKCSSHQDGSADMQHDLLHLLTLTFGDPRSNLQIDLFRPKSISFVRA